MKKVLYFCNRCGKEVEEKKIYRLWVTARRMDLNNNHDRDVYSELCVDCLHEIELKIFEGYLPVLNNEASRLTGLPLYKKQEAV
ncbi:hypothetical protein [Carboxydothermus pertinax]|uniref:Uncharacterized protein n=1 Tax=Carboxydothermus pertinax TaxID=870242 RepID=A0A1L8CRZ1_9THEO|nr:hypothetical protein [Carboxydothermus pertinax]GAV21579.1 hypothetical protein cpu_00890 [Carboxydothermus pertinax]